MITLESLDFKSILEEQYNNFDGLVKVKTTAENLRVGESGKLTHSMSFNCTPAKRIKSVLFAIRTGRYFKGYERFITDIEIVSKHMRLSYDNKPLIADLNLYTDRKGENKRFDWAFLRFDFTPVQFKVSEELSLEIDFDKDMPLPVISINYKIPVVMISEDDKAYVEEPVKFFVEGGEAVKFCAHVPSIVNKNNFKLNISALDRIGNLDGGFQDILKIYLEGKEIGQLQMEDGTAEYRDFVIPQDGMYKIQLKGLNSGISASSNYFLVDTKGKYNQLVWGDIHGHSIMSDGTSSIDEHYKYSRDTRYMEVASVTDHDNQIIANNSWNYIQSKAREWSEAGKFIALPAYEWAQPYEAEKNYGHKNIYFSTYRDNPLYSGDEADRTHGETPEKLYEKLSGEDCVIISHHPAYDSWMWTDWDHFNPEREQVVEVYSTHGASDEINTIKPLPDFNADRFILPNLVKNKNIKLGFIGGSDCHAGLLAQDFHSDLARKEDRISFKPYRGGLTAFWVNSLTIDNVLGALKERRVYATTGEKLLLLVEVNNRLFEPEVEKSEEGNTIKTTFGGSAPVSKVEIFRNGVLCHSVENLEEAFVYNWTDNTSESEASYFVRVTQQDNQIAWSAVTWVR